MIVDIVRKVSLDAGSTPASSTSLCRQWPLTRRDSAVLSGLTGFDSLRVWIKEIMVAVNGKSINMFNPSLRAVA